MEECVFCKIANKQLPASVIHESDEVLAFEDINPSADVHILIIPKKHIGTIKEAESDGSLLSTIFTIANIIVEEKGLKNNAYRIVVNGGKAQQVPHLHFHLLGGTWRKHV